VSETSISLDISRVFSQRRRNACATMYSLCLVTFFLALPALVVGRNQPHRLHSSLGSLDKRTQYEDAQLTWFDVTKNQYAIFRL
jgi:hypothetical protein